LLNVYEYNIIAIFELLELRKYKRLYYGEDSGEKTNSGPPNIRDTTYFPNLNSQPFHPTTLKNTPPNATANQSESNIVTQLSSFISEFKLIINPLISLLTTVVNRLMKDDK